MAKSSQEAWAKGGLILVIVLAAVVSITMIPEAFSQARRAAKQSAQYALFKEIVDELERFRRDQGQYPQALTELSLTYPDGGDVSLLQLFQYETDGQSYSLSSVGVATKSQLKAHSTEGQSFISFGN